MVYWSIPAVGARALFYMWFIYLRHKIGLNNKETDIIFMAVSLKFL